MLVRIATPPDDVPSATAASRGDVRPSRGDTRPCTEGACAGTARFERPERAAGVTGPTDDALRWVCNTAHGR
jgi:hypothetical protein